MLDNEGQANRVVVSLEVLRPEHQILLVKERPQDHVVAGSVTLSQVLFLFVVVSNSGGVSMMTCVWGGSISSDHG